MKSLIVNVMFLVFVFEYTLTSVEIREILTSNQIHELIKHQTIDELLKFDPDSKQNSYSKSIVEEAIIENLFAIIKIEALANLTQNQ